jgi:ABC-type enterochelin transport system ATPase subunit
MDVLAERKTGGYIEGDISISGYPKKQPLHVYQGIVNKMISSSLRASIQTKERLVPQSSCNFHPYEGYYLVDRCLSLDVQIFTEEVMELMELKPLRNALVGLPGVNGLSTEQRKRLTIAVELVANPSIIFMNKPTSGLDARAVAIVMRTMRKTVDTGRTVVCTIHQPDIDIFEAFDEVSEISHMITSSYPLLSFWLAFGHILVLLWLFFQNLQLCCNLQSLKCLINAYIFS